MDRAPRIEDNPGSCRACGGRISATHMLTKTYELDSRGSWRRALDDFNEDVVVVCVQCGEEPEGAFDTRDGEFLFVHAPEA